MNRLLLTSMAILLSTSISMVAQGKGWRGIVPLRSTRGDVERLFGPGTNDHYQSDQERVHVNYAGEGNCNPVNGCVCLVRKDTVISIYVQPEYEMSFSKLNLDRKKYEKYASPEDPTVATYSNDREGIIYTVDEKNDDVMAIEYLPTDKDCKDLLRNKARVKKSRQNTRIMAVQSLRLPVVCQTYHLLDDYYPALYTSV